MTPRTASHRSHATRPSGRLAEPGTASAGPSVLKPRGPADLLALMPHLAGVPVEGSLVLAPFIGTRTDRALRVDLPSPDLDDEALDRFATTIIGMLMRLTGITGVAIAVFDESGAADAVVDFGGRPHEALVRQLELRLDAAGVRVIESLWRGRSAWGSYLEGARRRDLAEVDAALEAAEPDLPALERLDPLPAPPDLAARERCARILAALTETDAVADAPELVVMLADLGFAELMLGDAERQPRAAAVLLAGVDRPALRDIVMLGWAFDVETSVEGMAAARDALERGELDTPTVLLGQGEPPEAETLLRAIRLTERLLELAPRSASAPVRTMLGWLHWARGHGTEASRWFEDALTIEPGYGLATLMRQVLDAGMVAEWAFRPAR